MKVGLPKWTKGMTKKEFMKVTVMCWSCGNMNIYYLPIKDFICKRGHLQEVKVNCPCGNEGTSVKYAYEH